MLSILRKSSEKKSGGFFSPYLILADEPTGNLDAESANEVVMLMSKAARLYNQTILMVTHDRQMADYADRILRICDGEVKDR